MNTYISMRIEQCDKYKHHTHTRRHSLASWRVEGKMCRNASASFGSDAFDVNIMIINSYLICPTMNLNETEIWDFSRTMASPLYRNAVIKMVNGTRKATVDAQLRASQSWCAHRPTSLQRVAKNMEKKKCKKIIWKYIPTHQDIAFTYAGKMCGSPLWSIKIESLLSHFEWSPVVDGKNERNDAADDRFKS